MTASVGTVLPPLRSTVSRDDLVRYAGASTDFNPIHHSDRRALALGLPGV
ncbi:MAG: dehydratase, partial [Propionibacteriaceae bacterium]|nr:dehydratase [Propionibacteriaceae bacterium]